MCGIAGFLGFKNDELINKFSKELEHRGPDGEGVYSDADVSLLNRRLSIIDLKTGDQPIYNEDKSIVVVYNGEIYNFKKLREALHKTGHRFSTKSDTEVIVHAYEQWGTDSFDKFNGMFAIALYDIKKKTLILARDHFGIKPLYYSALKNNRLVFASEIKPIINSGLVDKKINERILYRYLCFRVHDDNKETFFEGVHRFMPGEMMSFENGKMRLERYSSLEDELLNNKSRNPNSKLSSNDQIQKFKNSLFEAIRLRLISDVPVGTCLSGGIDSSTIAAVVNKQILEKVKEAKSVGRYQNTFSAVFPGEANDEETYIEDLAKHIDGIRIHKVSPMPEDFFEDLMDFVKTQEEPTISTGPYAQYRVMRDAKKYVKVLLDGQGADEIAAGYLPYYFVYLRQLKKQNQWFLFFKELLFSHDVVLKYFWLKLKQIAGLNRNVNFSKILAKQFRKNHKDERFVTVSDNLKKRLIRDVFYDSLPSLLRYEDKNSMRFSIEGRVPFLDFNLLKYLFSLPDTAIIKNGWNKAILRNSVKKLLPKSIIKRRNKIGFTTPENEWFMRMKNRIYSIFLSESFAKRRYFNQQEVLKSFQKFIKGKTDDSMAFWRILNTEMWLRTFFAEESPGEKLKAKSAKLDVNVRGREYNIHLIKTDVFQKSDDYINKIVDYVMSCGLRVRGSWFVVVSEKIVAIAQGRSYFIWDIKPGVWAKFLHRFVAKTPYGIGLGSPWTMQLAIQEIGLAKILIATIGAAVTKPLGIKGMFYRIAGREAAAIDGPTEYSLYPSNVSAKLAPLNPNKVCEQTAYEIRLRWASKSQNFIGVVIMDANDLGRNVLGNSTNIDNKTIEEAFCDNPMGQEREQTPIAIVSFS